MREDEIYLGVVTPMANEGEDAVRFVEAVLGECGGFRRATHFVVLDKVTRDNSRELLEAHGKREPRLNVVWAPECRNLVQAYIRGYREALAAGCDWVLEMDAGFSHDPIEMGRLIEPMKAGYDCAFGSRFMKGSRILDASLKRWILSRGGTLLANVLTGTQQTDMTSGYQIFRADVLQKILDIGLRSKAHFFQTEMKFHCRKLNYIEVPISYRSPSPRVSSGAIADSIRQLAALTKMSRFPGERERSFEQ